MKRLLKLTIAVGLVAALLIPASMALAVLAIEVDVDIKPASCPNSLNVGSKGVVSVAILGTEGFDVNTVDPGSVRLEGAEPLRWDWEDVATPFEGTEWCACHDLGPDGYLDLTLKFKIQDIVEALSDVNDGDVLPLTLTGNLKEESGGTPIEGEDCVWIHVNRSWSP